MDNKLPIYIQVFQGDAPAQVSKFTQENVIIGSGPAAHLRLDDHRVSRIHAMIKMETDGRIKLSDLGWSDEGTILNGNKIAEETYVAEGDQITIGSTQLCIYHNPPGEQFVPTAPAALGFLQPGHPSSSPQAPMLRVEEDIFPESTEVMMKNPNPQAFGVVPPSPPMFVAPPQLETPPSSNPFAGPFTASPAGPQDVFSASQDLFSHQPEEESPEPIYQHISAPTPVSEVVHHPITAAPAVAEPVALFVDRGPIPHDQLPPQVRRDMVEEDSSKQNLQIKFMWHGTTIDIGHFAKPRVVTVGGHPLNDFSLSGSVFPEKQNFPIVVPAESGFGAFFTDEFSGYVRYQDGSTRPIAELRSSLTIRKQDGMQGYVYPLQSSETLHLDADELSIEFSFSNPTKNYAVAAYRNFDYLYWRITSASFIAHIALILLFQFFPRGTSALTEELLKGRFAKLIVVPPAEPPKRREKKFELKKKVVEEKKKVEKTEKKVKDEGPVDQKTRDQQRVKRSGLLGLLNQGFGDMGPGGDIFGKAQSQQFLGKLLGASGAGTAFGMGFAGRGFGAGGGGGGGMYGGGGGFGYGGRNRVYGRGGMNMRGSGKGKTIMRIAPGRLVLQGALSKEEIARVVRMHWYQIRYCYESQLRSNPKLAGKVVVKWVIEGTGYVQTASIAETTMNNERVENCIARRVRRWKFPQPKGGGIVVVNYPFLFQVAGG